MNLEHWKPSCSLNAMKARAELYALVRAFFAERQVLEVETPILSRASATDPFLDSLTLDVDQAGGSDPFYLQTSPEFSMKRLVAAYQCACYQICKTFRNGESGSRHNPEFTMLEWYRPEFSLGDLLDETLSLVERVCGAYEREMLTYRGAFLRYLSLDPFTASSEALDHKIRSYTSFVSEDRSDQSELSRDDQLDLLFSICIEPNLGHHTSKKQITIVHEYPASMASLAKIKSDALGNRVAERFELYIEGLELANAYFELTDASEQLARFEDDNAIRRQLGKPEVQIDTHMICALESGMPSCSGIALGLDRLLMIKTGATDIKDVMAFPVDRA